MIFFNGTNGQGPWKETKPLEVRGGEERIGEYKHTKPPQVVCLFIQQFIFNLPLQPLGSPKGQGPLMPVPSVFAPPGRSSQLRDLDGNYFGAKMVSVED